MNTHNYISKAVVGIIGIITLSVPSLVLGATQITLQPAGSLSLEAGESITLEVYGTPDTETIYTLVGGLSFPSDIVSVSDFTFADGWQALSQEGYDEVDNDNGTLIKTGGYAGGFSTQTLLGTVTLTAEDVGSGNISVSGDAAAYDQDSVDVIADAHPQGTLALSVTQAQEPAVEAQTQATQDAAVSDEAPTTQQEVEDEGVATDDSEAVALQEQEEQEGDAPVQVAAVGSVLTLGTGSPFGTVLLIILLVAVGYGGYHLYRKRQRG